MKKSIIEVHFDKLNENSVIVYQKGRWVAINKEIFLNNVDNKLAEARHLLDVEVRTRYEEDVRILDKIDELEHKINYILGEEDEPESEEPVEEEIIEEPEEEPVNEEE